MANNETPKWSKELSADMRAFMKEAAEDRKQAAEDRERFNEYGRRAERDRKVIMEILKEFVDQSAKDRKRAEEDRRQARQDKKRYSQPAIDTGTLLFKAINENTKLSRENTKLLREILHVIKVQSNGKWNNRGNNRGKKK